MENYKLLYLPSFYNDLSEAADYIANVLDNPQAADKLISDVDKAIQNRSLMPFAAEPYRSKRDRKNLYYRIYVGNYVVFYFVQNDTMKVVRLIHGSRDYGRLL